MTRLVAFADLHIGKGSHLSPTRLAEQEAVFDEILAAARDLEVERVIIAGDLFDRRKPSPDEILAAERPLVAHQAGYGHAIPVIAIPGNHDLSDLATGCGLDVLAQAHLLELFRQPEIEGIDRTCSIAMLPWAPASVLRARVPEASGDEAAQAVADLLVRAAQDLHAQMPEGARKVLVTHFAIDGSSLPSGLPVDGLREPVLSADALNEVGFDAIVAGHIHRAQRFTLADGWRNDSFFYCGSPMPLDFGEGAQEHGYWVIDTESGDPPVFVPIESPDFLTMTLDQTHEFSADDAYVRVKDTFREGDLGASMIDARELERDLMAAGARYAKVELTVERAARARVVIEDENADPFGLWAKANEIEGEVLAELSALDTAYREKAIA